MPLTEQLIYRLFLPNQHSFPSLSPSFTLVFSCYLILFSCPFPFLLIYILPRPSFYPLFPLYFSLISFHFIFSFSLPSSFRMLLFKQGDTSKMFYKYGWMQGREHFKYVGPQRIIIGKLAKSVGNTLIPL